MDRDAVHEIEKVLIREVAAILSIDPAAITADIPIFELGVDSLSFVELLVVIEKNFDLRLMESGLSREDFQTIGSLAACINRES